MTRQQRRAAERTARKQARYTAPPESALLNQPARPAVSAPAPISEQRHNANRANAQLSTGPRSEGGKAVSSKNALKTALTGRTVLLPCDDADRYERHLAAYAKTFSPVGEREVELVQSLADAAWRLDRIPGLEEAIYYKGSLEFADFVGEADPEARPNLLRMHTLLAYERQLRNLHTQEMRLHRLREKLQAELKQLQAERQQAERVALHEAAMLYSTAKREGKEFDPVALGFEFSTAAIEAYLHRVNSASRSQIGLPPSSSSPKERADAA